MWCVAPRLSPAALSPLSRVCAPLPPSHAARVPHTPFVYCVCCRVQTGWLPLHYAAQNKKSEAVMKALLAAYPDAAKAKAKVRCGRGRRVLCPLLSHSSHMRSMPSPPRLFSLAAVQWGDLPKDYAKTDAIKALLAVKPGLKARWGSWWMR